MNEKIKELIKQATTEEHGVIQPFRVSTVYHFDKEKFAELLILECSSLCYNSHLKDADAHAMNILNHFNIDGARNWK